MAYLLTFIASLSGFLFGFDQGLISGVLKFIQQDFDLTDTQTGIMMGCLPIGAFVIASVAGRLSDWIGRLSMLKVIAIMFLVGLGGFAASASYAQLCITRFALGLGIGMSVVVTPLYIAETAPTVIRGRLVTYFQLAITLGILGAYVVNLLMAQTFGWRWVILSGIAPTLALLIGCFFLMESPRWLYLKGRVKEAHRVLGSLHKGSKDSGKKAERALKITARLDRAEQKLGIWKELLSKRCFPSLVLGVTLFLFQQLSGINAVIYYAPTIFNQLQIGDIQAQLWATVGLGVVNCLATLITVRWIEKIGRRPFLMIGFVAMAILLALIAFITQFTGSWVAPVALFLYIAAFACSLGPLPYILISEIFPLSVRGPGMSLSGMSNWAFNALIVATFPVLLDSIGISIVFLIYAAACVLGLLFTLRYVPETRGASLEEIEAHIYAGEPLRNLGTK